MADTNELTQSRTVRNGGVGCVYELDWHQATSGNKIAEKRWGALARNLTLHGQTLECWCWC